MNDLKQRFRPPAATISSLAIEQAGLCLARICHQEAAFPDSPVTPALVALNIEHTQRVRANAKAIAAGDGLDPDLLELAAVLHDVAKLDPSETAAGGIDTWHHHYRGAALARTLALTELGLGHAVAEAVAALIETHSAIPFIDEFWQKTFQTAVAAPQSLEQLALRDADAIDMLWVGGMAKIIRLRQIPGSTFFNEDSGDIQNAIASARTSFSEAAGVLASATAKAIAAGRITAVAGLFERLGNVYSLVQFEQVVDNYLEALKKAV